MSAREKAKTLLDLAHTLMDMRTTEGLVEFWRTSLLRSGAVEDIPVSIELVCRTLKLDVSARYQEESIARRIFLVEDTGAGMIARLERLTDQIEKNVPAYYVVSPSQSRVDVQREGEIVILPTFEVYAETDIQPEDRDGTKPFYETAVNELVEELIAVENNAVAQLFSKMRKPLAVGGTFVTRANATFRQIKDWKDYYVTHIVCHPSDIEKVNEISHWDEIVEAELLVVSDPLLAGTIYLTGPREMMGTLSYRSDIDTLVKQSERPNTYPTQMNEGVVAFYQVGLGTVEPRALIAIPTRDDDLR